MACSMGCSNAMSPRRFGASPLITMIASASAFASASAWESTPKCASHSAATRSISELTGRRPHHRSRITHLNAAAAAQPGGSPAAKAGAVASTPFLRVACVFLALFMLDVSFYVAVPNMSDILATLGQDSLSTANLISNIGFAGALFEFLTMPILACLSDDVGRRRLLIGIPALATMVSLLAFAVPSVWTFCVWRACMTSINGWYATMASIYIADCFAADEIELASMEGKLQAAIGAAAAFGSLLGGQIKGIYAVPATAFGATLALLAASVSVETLPRAKRVPFRILSPSNSPAACLKLFRNGRSVAILSAILGLQALHNEGGIWPLLAEAKRGWRVQEIALYGALYGVVATVSGLFTGSFVRTLGPRLFTISATFCAAMALLTFTAKSNVVACSALAFTAISNSCSVAVMARILYLGNLRGISYGALMSAMLSLCAVMRVVGVGAFGSLYTYGSRIALPELPYYVFALVQLGTLACILPVKWGSDAEEQEVKQEVKQAKGKQR